MASSQHLAKKDQPKGKRRAISLLSSCSLAAALQLHSPTHPMLLPGTQGISWIVHHSKALQTLWLLLTQTHIPTNTTVMLDTSNQAAKWFKAKQWSQSQ